MFCSWNGTLFVCVLTPEAEEVKAVHWKVISSKHRIHVLHLIQKENTELLSVKLKIKSSCWHSCIDPTQTSFNTESETFHFSTYRSCSFIQSQMVYFIAHKVNIRHSNVMKLAVLCHIAVWRLTFEIIVFLCHLKWVYGQKKDRRVTEVALLFSLSRIYDKRDRGGIDVFLGSLSLHRQRVWANFTVQNITV